MAPSRRTSSPAAPTPAAAVGNDVGDSVGLRRQWPQILDKVRDKSRRTRALLDNAPIGGVEGTTGAQGVAHLVLVDAGVGEPASRHEAEQPPLGPTRSGRGRRLRGHEHEV